MPLRIFECLLSLIRFIDKHQLQSHIFKPMSGQPGPPKRGSTLPASASAGGGVDRRAATLPPGGGVGRGGAQPARGGTLPARGSTVTSRAAPPPPRGGAAPRGGMVTRGGTVPRGGTAPRGGTTPRGGTAPRGGTVPRSGTVTAAPAPPREAGSMAGSQADGVPAPSEHSEAVVSKIDAVAVAQRTLAVPIGEVVRNHHERLALLEEKVRPASYPIQPRFAIALTTN